MLQSVTEPLLGVVLGHRVDNVTECYRALLGVVLGHRVDNVTECYRASIGCCVRPSS